MASAAERISLVPYDELAATHLAYLTTGKGFLTVTQTPNQYHLQGGGISVSYFPDGQGPVHQNGPLRLVYQDAHRSAGFYGDEVRTDSVEDLGVVVSVTLVPSVDIGFTGFSLLIPQVQLPDEPGPWVFIRTEGITTVHRASAGLIGHPQAETYTVTELCGTAGIGVLPD